MKVEWLPLLSRVDEPRDHCTLGAYTAGYLPRALTLCTAHYHYLQEVLQEVFEHFHVGLNNVPAVVGVLSAVRRGDATMRPAKPCRGTAEICLPRAGCGIKRQLGA